MPPSEADIEIITKKAQRLQLTPEELQGAQYFAIPRASRQPVKDFAKSIGVSSQTVYAWRFSKKVQAVTREFMRRYFFQDLPDLLEAMKAKALSGDPYAFKVFVEYVEDYMNKNKTVNNFNGDTKIYVSQKEVAERIKELDDKFE